jgi:hypothetical protein
MDIISGVGLAKTAYDNLLKFVKVDDHEKIPFNTNPLNCIIKLAICSFLPKSRISLYKHQILIQKHDYKQAIVRRWNGDTRKNMHKLNHIIILACERFSLEYLKYRYTDENVNSNNKDKKAKNNNNVKNVNDIPSIYFKNLKYIFNRAIICIDRWLHLYKDDSETCCIISQYKTFISDYINCKKHIDIIEKDCENIMVRDLIEIWTPNRLSILFNLFNEIHILTNNNNENNEKEHLLDSIINFVKLIDVMSSKIITSHLSI